MRSPRIEFAVGAFLLLALASVLVLALASTNRQWGFGGDSYPLTARFTSIGALRPNAPVKIAGVAVGKVADIQVDPVKYDSVVTIAMDLKYKDLPADTSAGIFTNGLLGESYIGLSPGGDPETLKPGDEIFMTQPAVDLIQMVGKYMFSGGGKPGGDTGDTAPDDANTEIPADPATTETPK
jgi:phospholipid/cholesterol/gamma-HCH transport system substrate-binding protein